MYIEVGTMCIMEEMKKACAVVDYQGYNYSLSSIIEILVFSLMCKMTTLTDIHYWAASKSVRPMLKEHFSIWGIYSTNANM